MWWRSWAADRIGPGLRVPATWLVAYYAVYAVWFALTPDGERKTAWSDFAYLPAEGTGVLLGLTLLITRRGLGRRQRLSWLFVTAAIACRLFADASWWWLEGIRHLTPFPGQSDVGYSAFYPLLLLGLLMMVRGRRATRRERLVDGLDVLTITAAAFGAVWYFALGPVIVDGTDHGLAAFLDVYYPVADVVLVAAAARVLIRTAGRSMPVLLVLAACILLVAADTAYPYLSVPGSAIGGEWVDLLWVGSCVATAAAVDARRRAPVRAMSDRDRPPSLAPLVAVLGAGLVLVRAAFQLPPYPVLATAVAVVVVMSSSAWRQLIASREYAQLAMRYRQLAIRDALTGVMSRAEGLAQGAVLVAQSTERNLPCGVLMLDMDRFKQVNDDLGHQAGDAVLAAVAHRVTAAVRDHDLVARYGGDEFLVVLPGADDATAAEIAERIEQNVAAEPVRIADHVVPVAVTAGASSATGVDLPYLVAQADAALLTRKAAHRQFGATVIARAERH